MQTSTDIQGYDPLDTSPGGAYAEGGELILLYGVSRSGKTHMAKFLTWLWVIQKKLFDFVYAFNGGPSRGLETILRPELISPVDLEKFKKFLVVTKKLFQKGKRTLLILDDIGGCRPIFEKPALKSFWTTYRHYGVTILACTHIYTQIPKDFRVQVNVWMIMAQPLDDDELKRDLAKYAKQGQQKLFYRLLDMVADDANKFMCLACDIQRREFQWLKAAVEIPPFKL